MMRPKGSLRDLEARRRKAVKLLQEDLSLNEVARRIGCHASSVMRWRDLLSDFGEQGLKAKAPPGRPQRLRKEQKEQLLHDLLLGPAASGYQTQIWTTQRIAQLIERRFTVSYHPDHVGRIMHALGWSHQKPERRAIERNEAAIEEWKRKEWPRVKKTPRGWVPT